VNFIKDIWRYRYAIKTFVARDLTVRYKRSVLGFIWSFLQPLLLILTFVIMFKVIMVREDPNYSVLLFCAMLPWRFLQQSVMDGIGSVQRKIILIKRVNFPRIILPVSSLAANFIDFLFSMVILVAYFLYVGVTPKWDYLPLILLAFAIQIIFSFGLSLTLSSLRVFYSDIQYLVGSIFQMWLYLTPILYSAKLAATATRFSTTLKLLYFLNPMTPLVMAYKSIIPSDPEFTTVPTEILPGPAINGLPHYYTFLAISAAIAVLFLFVGVTVFKKCETQFAKN